MDPYNTIPKETWVDPGRRREFVRNVQCQFKFEASEDEDGIFFLCDKTNKECFIDGKCHRNDVDPGVEPIIG